ncbi:TonB-dependent receptor [uncultured Prevotella sp.]|mgnify:CR=1 FL=1|uniref:TonB-dependent receptor n=1 Tax=uncultured Prevotella sp. TaxID=159272 RepID=UPI0027E318DC|nr:TonB-dependent receptor [uncultured Prevotella sp.]
MMKNKKLVYIVLPLFINLFHALTASAKAMSLPKDSVRISAQADSVKRMMRDGVSLKEVVVSGSSNKEIQMKSALNVVRANQKFIEENFSGSLMQTLSRLPGVQAMNVGSGESKPVIRGLGFNRVLVAENGIKHEGQQWGDDHGLEIDQYAIDQAEVIKGPASLTYGSDAIGGVINLKSNTMPLKKFAGQVNLFGRTNNESIGSSVRLTGRNGKFWYKANATWMDYADYKVPADSIEYYSYWIKLKDQRLRNTAGREMDGNLMLGYAGDRWNTSFRIADVNAKAGFFANAHGLEVRLSDIDYDSSRRDIDLPYHTVNHFWVSNHTDWNWADGMLESNFAYQNNRQRELAEPVSHGYMPIPTNTLERSFTKQTFSANVKAMQQMGKHDLQAGGNVEYQRNRQGGWGFILPDFEQLTFGVFAMDKWNLSDKLSLTAGARFYRGSVRIHSYHDWYKTPLKASTSDSPMDGTVLQGTVQQGDSTYMERSANLRRSYNSFTWSVGVNRMLGDWVLKLNVGKSFRMPIAKELGMDGVNYNIFRYEKGNTSLKPEESYQVDAGIVCEKGVLSMQLTPYLNYFPNYIYLNPTPQYKEGLQLYYYTQAKVLRWGFEASVSWKILPYLKLDADGEYLYARQLSGEKKGYGLPFSTPWSARAELRYLLPAQNSAKSGFVALEWQVVGTQDIIVPPEEKTKGHQLLNASIGKKFKLGENQLEITLRGENLLGKRYYDHTSYYRLMGVPEPGRNFSAMVSWNF